ncbi:MAG: hypothetical protein JW892_10305, partial [Anaerolineae bacterium]|nr:hypothetical protein [Anaerolineae bacterium]
ISSARNITLGLSLLFPFIRLWPLFERYWAKARYKKCFWLPRVARQPKTLSKIAVLAALDCGKRENAEQ